MKLELNKMNQAKEQAINHAIDTLFCIVCCKSPHGHDELCIYYNTKKNEPTK